MDHAEATRVELSNGLLTQCVPLPHVHRAVIDVHVRVGPLFETPQTTGLSHLLEHMLHRGIPGHPSAHAQAVAFEELGAEFSAVTYVDHGVLSCAVPPENFESALALFADVLKAPVFSDLELEKGIIREEILEALDDDGHLLDIDCLLRSLAFPDHPLGYSITGTIETLEAFDLDAVRKHHRAHYASPSLVLTLSGAIARDEALTAAERVLSDLARAEPPQLSPVPPQSSPRFHYARRPTSQTALRLAFRAPGERDPDEPATEMLLRVLDDGMSTRLYQRLCDERGLCYDVSATYDAYPQIGLFDVAAESAHENAEAVLEQLLLVLRALKDDGPTELELGKARARVGWQLSQMLDDPAEIASFYGLGALTGAAKTLEQRRAELSDVDASRVQEAAARIFTPERASLVALGRLSRRTQDTLQRRLSSL